MEFININTNATPTTNNAKTTDNLTPENRELLQQLKTKFLKFELACKHVVQLNNAIEAIDTRSARAQRDNRRSAMYSLRLQLLAVDGVRAMMYDYCCVQADALDKIQARLLQQGIVDPEIMQFEEVDAESDL